MAYRNEYDSITYRELQYNSQETPNSDLLVQDASLGEYMLCHRSKMDLKNLVNSIVAFLLIHSIHVSYIDQEKSIYVDTVGTVHGVPLFDKLIEYLSIKSDEFVLQLGTASSVSPTFVESIKQAYADSTILQADANLNKLLGNLNAPADIIQKSGLTENFITTLVYSMMGAVIEKLSNNFRGSEFVIALNLAIMEFNYNQFDLKGKIDTAIKLMNHMITKCSYDLSMLEPTIQVLETSTSNYHLLPDGEIDYLGWAYYGLVDAQIKRIESARKAFSLILNNSWNEIASCSTIGTLLIRDGCYPNIQPESE